jgi:type IV pilus assembly protein PilO
MAPLKFDTKNLPPYAKVIIAVLPSVIVALIVVVLFIMPKQKEIQALNGKIDDQNNQIAASQAKGARLDVLIKENEQLLQRLNELKEQLPEEKEISNLLKQVSDICIDSGLDMKSWRPGHKVKHPSGIVYETPVSVAVIGTYHDFGKFLSNLTKLNRIVNVKNIQIGSPQVVRGSDVLQISFTASTFTAIPEGETGKK